MQGARIAVIGAGPAGLTFASVMADANEVTVFEKRKEVGGSFLLAGHAPKFQTVESRPETFEFYIQSMKQICESRGAVLYTNFDPFNDPNRLKNFDWIVIAAGAQLPFGLQTSVNVMLKAGLFKISFLKYLASNNKIRDLFYYSLRRPTAKNLINILPSGCKVSVIGDAAQSGKATEAIKSAYDLAYSLHG